MNRRRLVTASVAATTAALLTTGISGSEAQPQPKYPQAVTAAQEQLFQDYFDRGVEYWAAHGVPALRGVGLKIISGDDQFNCYGVQSVTSGSSSEYCAAGAGTVVLTAADIYGGGTELRDILTVGHELGHGVQDKSEQLPVLDNTATELGATCLAGEMMRSEFALQTLASLASGVMTNTDFFRIGDDTLHGSHQQQEAAFGHGFIQQNCDPYAGHPLIHA